MASLPSAYIVLVMNIFRVKGQCRLKGFTLVELLVVITVIAILAGLALPVIGTVRTKAMRVETVNNLRTVVIAFQSYLNDNNQTLPVGFQYANADRAAENWGQLLAEGGYLGIEDHNVTAGVSRSYEFSVLGSPLQRRNNPNQPAWDQATFSANSSVLGLIAADQDSTRVNSLVFQYPAQTLLISEGSTHGGNRFNGMVYGHNAFTLPDYLQDGKVSCAFLDGHVETMPLAEWPQLSEAQEGNDAWKFWFGRN